MVILNIKPKLRLKECNNAEYFHVLNHLICIPKCSNIFFKADIYTDLTTNNNYSNETIPEILTTAKRYSYPIYSHNPARAPITFMAKNINNLAIEMFRSRILQLEKYNTNLVRELNWGNLTNDREEYITKKLSKSQQNELLFKNESQYKQSLPEKIQVIFDYKKQLEKQKADYDKNKFKEKKDNSRDKAESSKNTPEKRTSKNL